MFDILITMAIRMPACTHQWMWWWWGWGGGGGGGRGEGGDELTKTGSCNND